MKPLSVDEMFNMLFFDRNFNPPLFYRNFQSQKLFYYKTERVVADESLVKKEDLSTDGGHRVELIKKDGSLRNHHKFHHNFSFNSSDFDGSVEKEFDQELLQEVRNSSSSFMNVIRLNRCLLADRFNSSNLFCEK